MEATTKYREIGQTPAPPAVATALGLGEDEPALVRRRTLYANGESAQIVDSNYPCSIVEADIPDDADPYSRLTELGDDPVRFTDDVTVRMPDDAEQRALELEAFPSSRSGGS